MKLEERNNARKLRLQGSSIKQISKQLNVAKSSVSFWVRDIILSDDQKKELSVKGIKKEVIERRRITRLANENKRRQIIIDSAAAEIKNISKRELWLIGVMLYWAEGGKTQSVVRFSNSDPNMIKIIMVFFRRICNVPEEKFRGHIHIHPHLDYYAAEKHWSLITKIPLTQFYKTYRKMNVASKNKKDNLPLGTMDVYICRKELLLKIKGWASAIFKSY